MKTREEIAASIERSIGTAMPTLFFSDDDLRLIVQALRTEVETITVEMMRAGIHAFKDFELRRDSGMSLERALVQVYEAMRKEGIRSPLGRVEQENP